MACESNVIAGPWAATSAAPPAETTSELGVRTFAEFAERFERAGYGFNDLTPKDYVDLGRMFRALERDYRRRLRRERLIAGKGA